MNEQRNRGGPDELLELDSLWDFQDPAACEERFQRAILHGRQADDLEYVATAWTQLARTQGLQGRFDEADSALDSAAAIVTDDREAFDAQAWERVMAWLALERGRVRNSAGDPEVAAVLFEAARKHAEAAGDDGLIVDAMHMRAIAEPERSEHWNLKALDLARTSEDPAARRWRAALLNNLGWTYHERGDFEDALRAFEGALAARREQGSERGTRIARWSVARAWRSLGRVDEALSEQRRLLEEAMAAEDEVGFAHEEIAECLLVKGDAEAARSHFAEAHRALSQDPWLVEREPERIARLAELGGVSADAEG